MDIYTFAQMYIGVLPGGAGRGRCCESSSSGIMVAEEMRRPRDNKPARMPGHNLPFP